MEKKGRIRRTLNHLGPGVVSGAANDDPSCISTYSVAGALFGYATLWTSLFCLPLIGAVQFMSSRLGMVSGRGLAGAVRVNFPVWVLFSTCALLFVANVVNIGADLGGLAEATEMLTGIPAIFWSPVWAAGIVLLLFRLKYRQIVRVFKWLAMVLFAYVLAGMLSGANWAQVLRSTLVPRVEFTRDYLSVLVGILGATLSPYLLFWQASLEVEEEYVKGRTTVREREGASPAELERSRVDVAAGAFFSRLITYFITLTTAATLHASGRLHIETARDAAEALHPVAGPAASLLFALGIIGTGALSIPVLAGSSAYALAEAAAWRGSLEHQPRAARRFYTVMVLSVVLGLALKFAGFKAVTLLFAAAVLNGLLAPPLIVLLLLLTRSERVMGELRNSRWLNAAGWVAVAVTGAAALGLLASAAGLLR